VDIEPLFRALRAAASDRIWDAGVQMARAGRVQGRSFDEDEVVLAVSSQGPVPVEVHLWPEDEEWDCSSGHAVSAYVVASAIAVRQSLKATGQPLPSSRASQRLVYRLERVGRRDLSLTRWIRRDGQDQLFDGKLRSSIGIAAHETDLVVEEVLVLGDRELPAVGWRRILAAWTESGVVVELEGEPLTASTESIGPVVLVKDAEEGGFRVSLHRDGRIDESFSCGVCVIDGRLHPTEGGGLAPHERRALVRGIDFPSERVHELVGELLPSLRERLTVKTKTERLPEVVELEPELVLRMDSSPQGLELHLDIVYGDAARVVDGRLVRTGRALPKRDRQAERKLQNQASQLRLPIGRSWTLAEEQALDFVQNRLPSFDGRTQGKARHWTVREEAASLSLDGQRLRSDAALDQLVAAWQEGRSLVPLTAGGWAPLPTELLERHGHLIADLVAASGASGKLPAHALPAAGELAEALDSPPPPGLERLRPLLDDFQGLPEVDLPQVEATLRPYQVVGYHWLCFLMKAGLGGILADDMGLGKTLQALCAMVGRGGRSLVVAPTSVAQNWVAEAGRFFPKLKVCLFHGPTRKMDPQAQLVVTTYALLRLDPAIRAGQWTCAVLDEAQNIKNPESQTAQAAFQLQAEHRFSLTGTPIENRLDELWSQLHYCIPGFLGGRRAFQERLGRAVEAGDHRAARALRARIRPFVLRRRKSEVATDLPPRTDITLRCVLEPRQREVYEAVAATAREEVAGLLGDGKALKVLELLLRLRQAACHPALLPGSTEAPSAKLDLLVEKLTQITDAGHKTLVFSQWTSMLDLIQAALPMRTLRLDGSTRDRAGVVAEFQSPAGPPVFLLSLKAGGTGLNLTAADYVFHTDPWWNPAVEDQAVDRAHRIGQDKPVLSVRLIAEDTVEEGILELQERKRAIARAALEEGGLVRGLSKEDLLSLLS